MSEVREENPSGFTLWAVWRRHPDVPVTENDATELETIRALGQLYAGLGRYREALEAWRSAGRRLPDLPQAIDLQNDLANAFRSLFLDGRADGMEPVQSLALFFDFRELTPIGADGDMMVRKLARRLVDVDLLDQAASLLKYQTENRLDGVAKAQVATDLALIRIADHSPEAALRAINQTRMANLAPTLERERRILEARALIDADRAELALDLISRIEGRDADLLRVDGFWRSKNYSAAADAIEKIYSADAREVLGQTARMNVVKAAVGYLLANDAMGLGHPAATAENDP